jgi:hypothetical protein
MGSLITLISDHPIFTEILAGAYTVGKITDEQRFDVVRHSCPGAGACGGMYTYVLTIPTIPRFDNSKVQTQ